MKKAFAALCAAVLAVSAVSCGKKGVKTSIDVSKDKGQVILDNDTLTMTFESYDDTESLRPVINMKVRNKTDEESRFYLNDVCVNDFHIMGVPTIDNGDIPAGETVDSVISFYSNISTDIEEIGKFSFTITTVDPQATSFSDMYLESDVISFFTDNKDWEKNQKLPDGELLYDEDGVRITADLSNDYFMYGNTLPLFIENNSNEDIRLWLNSMRFDGVEGEMNIPDVGSIAGGKRLLRLMPIYSAYEEAGITAYDVFSSDSDENRPEKTEVKFTIIKYDSEDNKSSIETDYIEIKGLKQQET